MPKLSNHFETRTRDNGETFVTLSDDAPEWLREAVYDAHQDSLPCDWVYTECRDAVAAVEDDGLTEDNVGEYADGHADVYTKERFTWAAEFCLSSLFSEAEERASELNGGEDKTMSERLGTIQYAAIESIAQTMVQAIADNADSDQSLSEEES